MFARRRSPERSQVYVGGYTFDEGGLRIWPLRRNTLLWSDLTEFDLETRYGSRPHHRLSLAFPHRRKPVKVACGAGAEQLQRLVRVLGWIAAKQPDLAGFKRQSVMDMRAAVERVPLDLLKKANLSDEERLDRARFWLVALKPNKAVKECAILIERRGPCEAQAAVVKIDAHLVVGEGDAAVETLEDVLTRRRGDAELVSCGARLLLDRDDTRGEALAEEAMNRNAPGAVEVALRYSVFHIRRRNWDAATAMLDRCAQLGGMEDPIVKAAIEELRKEITEMKASPAVAFRRLRVRPFLVQLGVWGFLLALFALFAAPLFLAGPEFVGEARKLRQLEAHGVQVGAAHMERLTRREVRDTMLAELVFEFAPDLGAAEPWDLPLPKDFSSESIEAFERLRDSRVPGGVPRGWYRGRAVLYKWTAVEIQQDQSLQYITYLADDPEVCTIGPITSSRVWFTWLAGGKGVLMGASAIGLAILFALQSALSRLRRWSRGTRPIG